MSNRYRERGIMMENFETKLKEKGTEELKELSKLLDIGELEDSLRSLWEIVANAKLFKGEQVTQIDIAFMPEDQDNAAEKIKKIWHKVNDKYKIKELLEILKKNMILTSKEGEIRSGKVMDYSDSFNTGGYFYIRDFDGFGDTNNWDGIKKYIENKIKEL